MILSEEMHAGHPSHPIPSSRYCTLLVCMYLLERHVPLAPVPLPPAPCPVALVPLALGQSRHSRLVSRNQLNSFILPSLSAFIPLSPASIPVPPFLIPTHIILDTHLSPATWV